MYVYKYALTQVIFWRVMGRVVELNYIITSYSYIYIRNHIYLYTYMHTCKYTLTQGHFLKSQQPHDTDSNHAGNWVQPCCSFLFFFGLDSIGVCASVWEIFRCSFKNSKLKFVGLYCHVSVKRDLQASALVFGKSIVKFTWGGISCSSE